MRPGYANAREFRPPERVNEAFNERVPFPMVVLKVTDQRRQGGFSAPFQIWEVVSKAGPKEDEAIDLSRGVPALSTPVC